MPAPANNKNKPVRDPRDLFFHFRCTRAEIDVIHRNAAQGGLRPGVFVRDVALSGGKLRIVSRVDESAVFELRRLGAMLKGLYPKTANWTNEEKRRHWDAMKAVLEHADKLAGDAKDPAERGEQQGRSA
ncbi:plasmid mobilization protein [Thiomonas sp.]